MTYNILTFTRWLVRAKKVADATASRPHECLLVEHLNRCKLCRVKLRRDTRDLLSSSGWDSHSIFLFRLRLHIRGKYLSLSAIQVDMTLWQIDSLLIVTSYIVLVVDPLGLLAISLATIAGVSLRRALLL